MTDRSTTIPAICAATLLAGAAAAHAHPHVFAEARLDVVVSQEGTVESLRHLWRFDDVFSSTVLLEFDVNQDLELNASELETVASVVYDSLSDFGYFQIVTRKGADVAMQAPEKLVADVSDGQLLILFESEPAEPLPLTDTVSVGVYDPTFYTAIEFLEDKHMAVEGLPQGCTRAVVRPDPDEAIAQNQDTLTDAFFNEPGGNDLSKIFATRMELRCPANG